MVVTKHLCPIRREKCAHVNCEWWDKRREMCAVLSLTREMKRFNDQVSNIKEYGLTTKEV